MCGRSVTLSGVDGAGKTTTAKAVCGSYHGGPRVLHLQAHRLMASYWLGRVLSRLGAGEIVALQRTASGYASHFRAKRSLACIVRVLSFRIAVVLYHAVSRLGESLGWIIVWDRGPIDLAVQLVACGCMSIERFKVWVGRVPPQCDELYLAVPPGLALLRSAEYSTDVYRLKTQLYSYAVSTRGMTAVDSSGPVEATVGRVRAILDN